MLLSRALDGLGTSERLHVLDFGSGNAQTLEFLSARGAKVYFLDLADTLAEDPEAHNHTTITDALQAYDDTVFDVCLFWDCLHWLSDDQLNELNTKLESHIYSGTVGHAYCHHSAGTRPASFKILSTNEIEIDTRGTEIYPLWSYARLARIFHCMNLNADCIAHDGCMELYLTTSD